MAKGDWWFKFEYLKWLTDEQLSRCSLETQGFWMRCICMMRKSDSAKLSGTVAELSRLLSVTPQEFRKCFSELSLTKTAGVTQTAQNFTLMSRKFAKELKVKEQSRLRKQRERRHAAVTPLSHDRVISKELEVREEEEKEGREEAAKPPPAAPPKRVSKWTRIPNPFPITPEMWAWLAENVPGLNKPNDAHANFVEHWTNAPPGKAEKINWNLTWQKGMRQAKKWQDEDKRNGTNHRNGGPDRRTDADILRDSAEQIAAKYSN